MDREIGVEIMCKLDPVGFRDQPQQCAVGIERPGAARFLDFEPVFVVSIENGFGNGSTVIAEDDANGLVADPVDGHNLNRLRGRNAAD